MYVLFYACVYSYIHMYVHTHTYIYTCIYMCIYVSVPVYMYMHLLMCMYTPVYTCIYIYMSTPLVVGAFAVSPASTTPCRRLCLLNDAVLYEDDLLQADVIYTVF